MNVLTFDIEEWFHLLDNDSTKTESQWNNFEKRIDANVGRLFDILDSTDTKATFFIIGWIAKKYPELVKRISERYQIGSHTMNHQLIWQQTPDEFKKDVADSIKRLEDITGQKVKCFRAPGFSLRESESWAFDILAECGIEYDSSVFPAHHAHGGMPSYPGQGPSRIVYNGIEVKEFPITFKNFHGHHLVFSGGGYFRVFPYYLIKKWTKESSDYLLSYIHPRDLDCGQPMIKDLTIARKFKSYVGLKSAERKLRRWLTEFDFIDIRTATESICWRDVPVVKL